MIWLAYASKVATGTAQRGQKDASDQHNARCSALPASKLARPIESAVSHKLASDGSISIKTCLVWLLVDLQARSTAWWRQDPGATLHGLHEFMHAKPLSDRRCTGAIDRCSANQFDVNCSNLLAIFCALQSRRWQRGLCSSCCASKGPVARAEGVRLEIAERVDKYNVIGSSTCTFCELQTSARRGLSACQLR